jgi:DNA-binding response OmpR family regulator
MKPAHTARLDRLEAILDDFLPDHAGDTAASTKARLLRLEAVTGFLARICAPTLEVPGLRLDRGLRTIEVEGHGRELKPVAFDLLWLMMARPGHVFSRSELHHLRHLARGSDAEPYDPAVDRSIDMHISALRRVVGRHRVLSHRGVGYSFSDQPRGR